MPGVVRMPDIDSLGHPNCTASPDVYTNNLRTARFTDSRGCGSDCGPHNVYANCLDVQTCGDPVTSGHIQVMCSSNVFVN